MANLDDLLRFTVQKIFHFLGGSSVSQIIQCLDISTARILSSTTSYLPSNKARSRIYGIVFGSSVLRVLSGKRIEVPRPNVRRWPIDGFTSVNISSGFFPCYLWLIWLRASHTTYRPSSHRSFCALKLNNVLWIVFFTEWFLHSVLPLSSRAYFAGTKILILFVLSFCNPLMYSFLPLIFLNEVPVCCSIYYTCSFSSLAVTPLVFMYTVLTNPEASSMNVTKHFAPPNERLLILHHRSGRHINMFTRLYFGAGSYYLNERQEFTHARDFKQVHVSNCPSCDIHIMTRRSACANLQYHICSSWRFPPVAKRDI